MKNIFLLSLFMLSFTVKAIPPESLISSEELKTVLGKQLLQGEKLEKHVFKKGITLDQLGLLGADNKGNIEIEPSPALQLIDHELNVKNGVNNISPQSAIFYKNRALAARQHVIENKAYKAQLNGVKFQLPIGVKKTIGNADYTIIIDSVKITPLYAYVVAYMLIDDTKNDKMLYFLGRDIRFTRAGGFTGEARLELLEDYTLEFGDAADVTFKVDPLQQKENYVIFDCDGFKRLHVDADILFSELFVPEDESGNPKAGTIKAEFSTDIEDWNNWIIEIPSIETFQIEGLEGVSFTLNQIALDKSDYTNPRNMAFPDGYWEESVDAELLDFWEGFYAQEITVKLPKSFERKDTEGRITISARDMIIDKKGFTGKISGQNIFTLNQGDLDSWSYSLDYFQLNFMHNSLTGGAFGGGLLLPIAEETHSFTYSSIIIPDERFNFTIKSDDELSFPLFGAANVTLYENSSVEITVENGKFKPKADLSGQMSIGASVNGEEGENKDEDGSGSLNLASITFSRMILKTSAPYLSLHDNGGGVSFGSDLTSQNMGKFPINILHIGFENRGNSDVALVVGLRVNLSKSEDSGFAGEADIAIVGQMVSENGSSKWKYKKAQLNRILVDVKNGGFSIWGEIRFFRQDPMFGNGFSGRVEATFKPGFTIKAAAIFGNKPEVDDFGNEYRMRYWYVDGMLTLPASNAIPIFTGVAINGFGGGAYYHMTMSPDGKGVETTSGLSYVPDKNTFLGVRAAIQICGYPTPAICKGEVNFEITFMEGGGIGKIAFYGMATIMTFNLPGVDQMAAQIEKASSGMAAGGKGKETIIPTNPEGSSAMKAKLNAKADGAIGASWLIIWDNENNSMHADLEVLVNVSNVLVGVKGPNNVAGQMVMHFEDNYWYIHAGTPSSPNALFVFGMVIIESYFMAGKKLEPFAPLPEFVENPMSDINPSLIERGSGVAFGSRVSMDTGDKRFLMFYARFAAGFGFDIMVIKFKPSVYCAGQSQPLGVNDWYAMGRSYAFILGYMGLQAKVFGKVKKFEIGYIAGSMAMGAKMPNPSFMVGAFKLEYRVLGGLIKGKCNFRLSIGAECDIVGAGEIGGIDVIATMSPMLGQKGISVFNNPNAALNMSLTEEFDVLNDDGKNEQFRAKVYDVKLHEFHTRQEVPGNYYFNAKKDFLTFKPDRALKAKTSYVFTVGVGVEKKYDNYDWRVVPEELEVKFTQFVTGDEPDNIPNENIRYAYPAVEMENYYKGEYDRGYIKMNMLQDKPLTLEKGFVYEVRYLKDNEIIYKDNKLQIVKEIDAKRHLEFNIPNNLFQNDVDYTLQIVKKPLVKGRESFAEESYTEQSTISEEEGVAYGNEMSVRNATINDAEEDNKEITIIEYSFHTSKYDYWNDKFETYTSDKNLPYRVADMHNIYLALGSGDETWEVLEYKPTFWGDGYEGQFVRGKTTNFDDQPFKGGTYAGYLKNTIYKPATRQFAPRYINPSDPIPNNRVYLNAEGAKNEINVATANGVLMDYLSIRIQLSERLSMMLYGNASFLNNMVITTDQLNFLVDPLLFSRYDPMPNGNYQVQMGYYLPGEKEPNHTDMVNFDFASHQQLKGQHSMALDYHIALERFRLIQLLLKRNIIVVPPPPTFKRR